MKLLLTFIISIPILVTSQEKTRVVPITLGDSKKATVEVDNTNKKVNPKAKYTYSWFKSKSILTTQGAYQGDLLHGTYQENYPSKQLKTQGAYKYGLKNGTWRYWNEQGELVKEENWKKGTEVLAKVKQPKPPKVKKQKKVKVVEFKEVKPTEPKEIKSEKKQKAKKPAKSKIKEEKKQPNKK